MPLNIFLLQYLLSLPEEIKSFVFGSEERRKFDKEDSREFWLNNDGLAQDQLSDLNAGDEITDELFEKLINSDADEIADFLVDYGYYGDKYSYTKQIKKLQERYDDEDSDFRSLEDKIDSFDISKTLSYFFALERLQNIRDFLLAIINLAKNFEILSIQSQEDSYLIRKDQEALNTLANKELASKKLKERVLATAISINEKGEIHFSISDWAKVLQGVDITRIRLCEVCEKIFWAKRSDAFACSPKHAKTRQMRLLRANWKEKESLYLKARQKKEKTKKEK